MGGNNYNVNVDFSSKDIKDVACKMIDKMCGGVGWIADKAWNKELALDNYVKAIQENDNIDDVTKAVMISNARRDLRRWRNSYKITMDAAQMILSPATIDDVDDDWAGFFHEKAGNIASPERQKIFSVLLAKECNAPGSIPKALITAIELSEEEAAADFDTLMSFCFKVNGQYKPLIIRSKLWYYMQHGLGVDSLNRLETIGLINMEPSALGGISQICRDDERIEYFENIIIAKDLNYENNEIPFGMVDLSYIGQALAQIITPHKIERFYEDIAFPYLKNPTADIDAMFEEM